MSLILGVHPRVTPDPASPSIITAVRAYVIGTKELEEKAGGGADCHSQVRLPPTSLLPASPWRPPLAAFRSPCFSSHAWRSSPLPAPPSPQASGHWIVDTPISNPMSVYQVSTRQYGRATAVNPRFILVLWRPCGSVSVLVPVSVWLPGVQGRP